MKNTNYPKTSFRISQENLDFLSKTATSLRISKSKILNFLLENYLRELPRKNLDSEKIKQGQIKLVKVFLDKQDYEILKTSAKNNLRSSVQNELKFHALNAICDTKILDYKELEAIALTRCELNKIGSNINQIARVLNSQNSFNVGVDFLESLNDLDLKIQKLAKEIKILATKTI